MKSPHIIVELCFFPEFYYISFREGLLVTNYSRVCATVKVFSFLSLLKDDSLDAGMNSRHLPLLREPPGRGWAAEWCVWVASGLGFGGQGLGPWGSPSEQLPWGLLLPGRLQLCLAGGVGQNPCGPARALGDPAPRHADAAHPGIPARARQPGRSRAIWLPGAGWFRGRLAPRASRRLAPRASLPPALPAAGATGAAGRPRGATTASALLEPALAVARGEPALAVARSRGLRGLPASPSPSWPRGPRLARPPPRRCRLFAAWLRSRCGALRSCFPFFRDFSGFLGSVFSGHTFWKVLSVLFIDFIHYCLLLLKYTWHTVLSSLRWVTDPRSSGSTFVPLRCAPRAMRYHTIIALKTFLSPYLLIRRLVFPSCIFCISCDLFIVIIIILISTLIFRSRSWPVFRLTDSVFCCVQSDVKLVQGTVPLYYNGFDFYNFPLLIFFFTVFTVCLPYLALLAYCRIFPLLTIMYST